MNVKQFENMAKEIISEAYHEYPSEVGGTLGTQHVADGATCYTTNGEASGAITIVEFVPSGTKVTHRPE